MKNIFYIMSVKRNYIVGIINDETIPQFETVLSQYATSIKESSSHMYFGKQPIDSDKISQDVRFFNMESESESGLQKKVNDLIADLNKLEGDYALRDDETGELLVTVRYGGQITVKFDNIKTLEKGTFKKIDEFKTLSTDFGYCKGFKPNFRPIEGNVENVEIKPEIIYITADSEENLLKLRDYLTDKIKEIDPDFLVEFTCFFDD